MTKATAITLLVTGDAPRSRRARANLADALEALGYNPGGVEEVYLLVHPQVALDRGIFASPALIIGELGVELLIMYGDLSDAQKLQAFLRKLKE